MDIGTPGSPEPFGDGQDRPQAGGGMGGSRPADPGRMRTPPTVRIEFVLVDGEAGKVLERQQAQAMRQVLQWLQDHPGEAPAEPHDLGTP
jgi:hypothetical protein